MEISPVKVMNDIHIVKSSLILNLLLISISEAFTSVNHPTPWTIFISQLVGHSFMLGSSNLIFS